MYSDRYLDGDLDAERLKSWTDPKRWDPRTRFTLMADQDGQPIGFAHVSLDADPKWGALVDNLHVTRAAQGQGFGTLLLDKVARKVIELRPGLGIYLWVLELNAAATAFYVARKGTLGDVELSPAPGGDPANLVDSTKRVRVTWSDPRSLLIQGS